MLKKNSVAELLWKNQLCCCSVVKKSVMQEKFKCSWGTNWTGAPVFLVSDSSLLSKAPLRIYYLEYLSLRVEFFPAQYSGMTIDVAVLLLMLAYTVVKNSGFWNVFWMPVGWKNWPLYICDQLYLFGKMSVRPEGLPCSLPLSIHPSQCSCSRYGDGEVN